MKLQPHVKRVMRITDRSTERSKPSTSARWGRVINRVTIECPDCKNNKSITTSTAARFWYFCLGTQFIREKRY